jgi:sulfur relay (sulfurtransferase) complex TusBCD TusD component (DsrE family)
LHCSDADSFYNQDCIQDAMKQANVDIDAVNACMQDSGSIGVKADNHNTKLDLEIQSQKERGVLVNPSVYVNTIPIHGALTTQF